MCLFSGLLLFSLGCSPVLCVCGGPYQCLVILGLYLREGTNMPVEVLWIWMRLVDKRASLWCDWTGASWGPSQNGILGSTFRGCLVSGRNVPAWHMKLWEPKGEKGTGDFAVQYINFHRMSLYHFQVLLCCS